MIFEISYEVLELPIETTLSLPLYELLGRVRSAIARFRRHSNAVATGIAAAFAGSESEKNEIIRDTSPNVPASTPDELERLIAARTNGGW